MTWTRSSDDFPDQLLELTDAAYRLHHAATCYANRLGLDGRIPKARLQLVPVPSKTRRAGVVRELVAAGHWSDDGDGYTIVDFLRDQPSAEEVGLQRRWDAARQQIRFAKGADRAEKQASLQRDADALRDALQVARNQRKARFHSGITSESQRPVPLRPDPARPAPSEDEAEDERRPRPTRPLGVVGRAADRMCPGCVCFIGRDEETIAARHDGRVVEWHVRCLKDWIGDFPEAEREMRIDPAVPLTADRDAATIQEQIDAVLRGETA